MSPIRVILNDYLATLRAAEIAAAPRALRRVPTIAALARACGVSRVTMSNFAHDQQTEINRDLLGCVIVELRRAGYPTTFDDLLMLDPTPVQPKSAP